ncbi:MAG: 4Fe-4S binding protein [Gammaproteobacteria bacterium]|nr:4Fe-4S binding protein [Gammaproteobacteria bacterium]
MHNPAVIRWFYLLVGVLLLTVNSFVLASTSVANSPEYYSEIREFFPGASRVGDMDGEPSAAPVYNQGQLLGYVFATSEIVAIPAYSGKPINVLVGLDLDGRITGVKIIEHHEPILLVGVSEEQLKRYIDQYRGINIFDRVRVGGEKQAGSTGIDAISGATITVMVANATIINSARKVAATRDISRKNTTATVPLVSAQGQVNNLLGRSLTSKVNQTTLSVQPDGVAPVEPVWVSIWRDRTIQIVILVTALLLLTIILLFQDWLVRRPRLYDYVRDGYLIFTVFFIGWYALAQLSVVNVLTFVHALFHDFHWETFALDPLIFILWGFVAITLLLWGRGVYCGWLCPFGALQEFINKISRHFNVRQIEFPYVVHERLWALKYIILIILFGVSLQSLSEAERLAEVEPFKTVILLQFQREWPFVLYAAVLLAISVFNRKFYCKYLCPLAAALIIPAQNRIFDWVRRHNECGQPCQVCAILCEVQAIDPNGQINKNECHYCLDCQVTYWNEHKCPPLVRLRKRRERKDSMTSQHKEIVK